MTQRIGALGRPVTAAFMARPIDLDARALYGIVHLIADHPDLTAAAHGHKVGHTPGKGFILAAVGNGAIRFVAMIEATDHPKALVAKGCKIDPSPIFRIMANGFSKEHPATANRF